MEATLVLRPREALRLAVVVKVVVIASGPDVGKMTLGKSILMRIPIQLGRGFQLIPATWKGASGEEFVSQVNVHLVSSQLLQEL